MGEQTGEAKKLDEAAGGLPVTEEVEDSTETNTGNPDNPDNPDDDDDVEDDKENDEEADEEVEDPEWKEKTAIQVFVDRDLRARLSRSTFHAFLSSRT